jgi:hypothetical protein
MPMVALCSSTGAYELLWSGEGEDGGRFVLGLGATADEPGADKMTRPVEDSGAAAPEIPPLVASPGALRLDDDLVDDDGDDDEA